MSNKTKEAIAERREAMVRLCAECLQPIPEGVHKLSKTCSPACWKIRDKRSKAVGIEDAEGRKVREDGKLTDAKAKRIWAQKFGAQEREYYAR